MIMFPNIDPVAVKIGPIPIRWYSLAYLVGIILGFIYFKWIIKKFKIFQLDKNQIDSLLTYVVLGIIFGGRLGYVLLYDPQIIITSPIEIVKTWQGGMSFHGGLIGYCIATYLFCKKNRINYISFLDISSCIAPIGLFFGRIANFINGELYGKITDAPWAMIFPYSDYLPRHPSQLYEAFFEGIFLLCIQNILLFKQQFKNIGLMAGVFAITYGITRFFIEFFREADQHIGYFFEIFSLGQLYCIILILVGFYLVLLRKLF